MGLTMCPFFELGAAVTAATCDMRTGQCLLWAAEETGTRDEGREKKLGF